SSQHHSRRRAGRVGRLAQKPNPTGSHRAQAPRAGQPGTAFMTPPRQDDSPMARPGVVEWLRPGEHQRARQVLADLRALRITQLRTGFSWADWHTPQGREWFGWLMETASQSVEILPCFTYTPPSLGIAPKTSSPPRD